jgi:hypothetical protein
VIVPTPERPSRTRGARSERELAVGLVLLALLAALLAHYALVVACEPDSPWPCRSSDVLRAQASATVTATAAAALPTAGGPLTFPTARPFATASVPVQPGVFPSATEPAFVIPTAPAFLTPTEPLVAAPTLAPVLPGMPATPTRSASGGLGNLSPSTPFVEATEGAAGYP